MKKGFRHLLSMVHRENSGRKALHIHEDASSVKEKTFRHFYKQSANSVWETYDLKFCWDGLHDDVGR